MHDSFFEEASTRSAEGLPPHVGPGLALMLRTALCGSGTSRRPGAHYRGKTTGGGGGWATEGLLQGLDMS